MGGDDVGVDGLLEHLEAVGEIDFPEGLAPFGERVAAPDVIDEDVEAVMLALDARYDSLHFGGDGVIDANGNAAASCGGDEGGGFFDGFAQARGIRAFCGTFDGAAPGAVYGGSGLAESNRDAASRAASGSGDEGDFAVQWFFGCGRHFDLPRWMAVEQDTKDIK